jgi:hypothetical protein
MTDFCKDNITEANHLNCESQILTNIENIFKSYYSEYNNNHKCYQVDNLNNSNCKQIFRKLQTDWVKIVTDIENYQKNYPTYAQEMVDEENNPSIISKYKELVEKRNKLDAKLYELYSNDYDSLYSVKPQMDATIVSGIIWTVVASTMIYYIVMKI